MGKSTFYLVVLALFGLTSLASTTNDWWEDASLYQIYPRSFKDSDGNGIGDLKGITEKLGYLKEIGMTATWLSPIFKSPMADNGYDISNFTDIDPIFGTLGDFDALVKKAKEIGIKLILDFVPNHSSDECEWFQKSINREDGYEDFYVWADGKDDPENPGNKLPPSNWTGVFGGSMWTWNEKRQQFYLHQFLEQQPDFNFRNGQVRQKMLEVLKFWLDRGVDGFRIDAVPHMFEAINEDGSFPDEDTTNNPANSQNQYETVELLYEWREFLESYRKDKGGDTRVLLAEAYSSLDMLDKYIGNGTHHGAQIPFNFALWGLKLGSSAKDVQSMVDGWMDVIWKKHKTANWVTGNHDMGRILDRVGQNKTDLVHFLLTGLPGVTITYYGEEIGMSNVITCQNCSYSESRSFSRAPFQWNDKVSAGFSSSNETWLPVADDYKTVNVENQRKYARSTLNIFKALQSLKNKPALKAFKDLGGFTYSAISNNVFQIIRRSYHDEYRFLINFGEDVEDVGKIIAYWFTQKVVMEYTVVSKNSPHIIGERVRLGNIKLMPLEGIVLRRVYG